MPAEFRQSLGWGTKPILAGLAGTIIALASQSSPPLSAREIAAMAAADAAEAAADVAQAAADLAEAKADAVERELEALKSKREARERELEEAASEDRDSEE